MRSPDIPNAVSPWVLGGLVSVLTVGVGTAAYVFIPSGNNTKEPEITRFEGISFPSDFFQLQLKKKLQKLSRSKKSWSSNALNLNKKRW